MTSFLLITEGGHNHCHTRLLVGLSNDSLEKRTNEQYPLSQPRTRPSPTVHQKLADVVLGLCASSPQQPIAHGIPEPDLDLSKDDVAVQAP